MIDEVSGRQALGPRPRVRFSNMLRMYLVFPIVSLLLCSCSNSDLDVKKSVADEHSGVKIEMPAHLIGTIGQFAYFQGSDMPVQGYSLVVGLGTNGSPEVPSHVREYLAKEVSRIFPDALSSRVLSDLDTAVVIVAGSMPFGAPVGTKFDLFVRALPQSGTKSLIGGSLISTELRGAIGGQVRPGGPTKLLADGDGALFVNPFVNILDVAELPKTLNARVISGGRISYSRPIRMVLREPDYARARQIHQRINERFPARTPVANARNRGIISITVPPEYKRDYVHFLRLLKHLPLGAGRKVWQARVRQIIEQLELPDASHDELGLVLEATGRQVVAALRPKYTSKNPIAAYYAARTGLRLEDDAAAEIIINFAKGPDRRLQLMAIEELGKHPWLKSAMPTLHKLIDSPNEIIRTAAYESLIKHPRSRRITNVSVGKDVDFEVDVVLSLRPDKVIYATQANQARIAIFGGGARVEKNVFFQAPGELVTISAQADQEKLQIFRRTPRTGRSSKVFECDFEVASLIRVLGSPARPHPNTLKIQGLGLTYSQVLTVLHKMCEQKHINAKFVLQKLPEMEKIYRASAERVGRPDKPGQ